MTCLSQGKLVVAWADPRMESGEFFARTAFYFIDKLYYPRFSAGVNLLHQRERYRDFKGPFSLYLFQLSMIEFAELRKDDLALLRPCLAVSPNRFCDYTLGNLYMWRHDLWTGFCLFKGTLLIEKEYEAGKFCFLCPVGEGFLTAVEALEEFCLAKKLPLRFFAVCESGEKMLVSRYPHAQVMTNRSWADYLYNLADLRDFPGKRYQSKRHNAERFYDEHPQAVFREATTTDVPRLETFLREYVAENQGRDISLTEMALSHEMLLDPPSIDSRVGYLEENGRVIGLSLGERRGDTIFQHIEKALREYPGIYQALTSSYLKAFGEGAAFVNREEDDGNPGLREAKLQLHPVALLRKSFFEVTNQFDLYHGVPSLQGPRILLSRMEEADQMAYFRLATDGKRNRYWGYDYQASVPEGAPVSPSYFYHDVLQDYENRSCLSLLIHDLSGQFLGEAVLYHFTSLNSAEIGIRLVKEAEGHGYAIEALGLLIDFAKNLGLRSLSFECFSRNERSLRLAARLGFRKTSEGDGKLYFALSLIAQ